MKRALVVVGGLVVIVVLLLALGRRRDAAREQEAVLPAVQGPTAIEAEGRVVPARGAALSLPAGGTVAEILVTEGTPVASGEVLLRLDSARQATAAMEQASAAVRRSRAHAAELRAGARVQELEAARSALTAAQARAAQLRAGARSEERAQAGYQVDQAEAALRLAEDDLTRTEQLLAIGAVPQQHVAQARTRRDTAAAQTAAAHQQLQMLQTGARPEELRAVDADVARARAQLDLLTAGVRPEVLAAADAEVASAQAALRQAQAILAQSEIRAPMAGTVTFIGVRVGEYAGPGTVVAAVADLSGWQVETTDLTELHVARIANGDRATVRLDGVPGLELIGRVIAVQDFGVNRMGDITYKVVVALDRQDPRLRWNMTAAVAIEAGSRRETPQN